MRCGDCRHWREIEEEFERGSMALGWGQCGAVKFRWHHAHDDETARADGPLAVVEDGSGLRASLLCRDAFGCVLFEAGDRAGGREGSAVAELSSEMSDVELIGLLEDLRVFLNSQNRDFGAAAVREAARRLAERGELLKVVREALQAAIAKAEGREG